MSGAATAGGWRRIDFMSSAVRGGGRDDEQAAGSPQKGRMQVVLPNFIHLGCATLADLKPHSDHYQPRRYRGDSNLVRADSVCSAHARPA